MYLLDVTKDFQTCVDHLFTKHAPLLQYCSQVGISVSEARRLAADHPNRPLFLRNLCDQVATYEHRFRGRVDKRRRHEIIAAASEMFVKGIIEAKRQELLSEAEKGRIRSQDALKEHVATLIKEEPSGTTQEENKQGIG